jgi:predicted nucleotidyltransferase
MATATTLRDRTSAEVARMQAAVAELKPMLAAYAREHGGRFVLFGSAARREMRPDSDVDIYVDFPGRAESEAARFAEELSWRFGVRPDILAFGSPAGRLRERVEKEGLVLPGDEDKWSGPMTDDERWGDILDAARSAAVHFRAAERIFLEGGLNASGDAGYDRRMAFYHSMQSAQTALESALKRTVVALGHEPPTGAHWHKALLDMAAKQIAPGGRSLLTPELTEAAKKTLGFRHFASHAYDAPFDPDMARPAVEAGRLIADRIEAALAAFRQDIIPD